VLHLLAGLDLGAREGPVTLSDLRSANEAFVTNAIGGVRRVASCAEVGEWPPGPVTRAADEALERAWGATRDDA
jgi:branched-subunit amino acid aminotransferase/4-amino-4-deoxychorismate lyase